MRRIPRALSSEKALVWTAGAWLLYYVTFAVWGREAFATTVALVRGYAVVKAVCIFSLAVLGGNLVRTGMARIGTVAPAALVVRAVLPLGIVVFLSGFLLSATFLESENVLVGEGTVIAPPGGGAVVEAVSLDAAFKREAMDKGGSGGFGVFAYEPKVVLRSQSGERTVGVYPPVRMEGAYYHILQFGLAPGVRLTSGETVLSEGYMALRLLPPGALDDFIVEPYPYRFFVSLAPERTLRAGGEEARVYNLRTPLYSVRVEKGEEVVFSGLSDGAVSFDGLALEFLPPTHWVYVEVARNPGLPVTAAGFGLIVLGVPLWLASAARDLVVRARRVYRHGADV